MVCGISGSFMGAFYLKAHEIIKKSGIRQRVDNYSTFMTKELSKAMMR